MIIWMVPLYLEQFWNLGHPYDNMINWILCYIGAASVREFSLAPALSGPLDDLTAKFREVSNEVVRLCDKMVATLLNLTGVSAALLPKSLSNLTVSDQTTLNPYLEALIFSAIWWLKRCPITVVLDITGSIYITWPGGPGYCTDATACAYAGAFELRPVRHYTRHHQNDYTCGSI